MLPRSISGTCGVIRFVRHSRIPDRSLRSPGVPKGGCLPVVTSMESFGYGNSTKQSQPPASRPSQGIADWVMGLAFAPDGSLLASGRRDGTVKLWGRRRGTLRRTLTGHTAEVYGLAFTPNSRSLLSGSDDGTLRLWDVEIRSACALYAAMCLPSWHRLEFRWHRARQRRLGCVGHRLECNRCDTTQGVAWTSRGRLWSGWSPNGRLLASSGWDNTIWLWDPTSGASVKRQQDTEHPDTVFFGMAWSPDGQQLACGTNLQGVRVWKVTTGSRWWVGHWLPTGYVE